MKEYRIVCDRKSVDYHGKEHISLEVAPWLSALSVPHYRIYSTKKDAESELKRSIDKAKKFDEFTQHKFLAGEPYAVAYWQSNFRIQNRDVTEWK